MFLLKTTVSSGTILIGPFSLTTSRVTSLILPSPSARGVYIKAFSGSLPVGAGLGSSAALCVATSAALTRLSSLISRGKGGRVGDGTAQALAGSTEALDEGDKQVTAGGGEGTGQRRRPSPSELELINSWAYAGETVLHGTPSGLDNTVSCYGGAIKFVKGVDGSGNMTEVRGQGIEAMFDSKAPR